MHLSSVDIHTLFGMIATVTNVMLLGVAIFMKKIF